MAETVLVSRLAEYVNPWRVLGISRTRRNGPMQDDFKPEERRDAAYHHARIRHFAGEAAAGRRIDPIEVDCRCDHGRVWAQPVLLDGHHRLAGAILAGTQRIRVSFGGRVDLKEYLQGKREEPPKD